MAEISDEAYLEAHPEHRDLDPNIRAQLRQMSQLQADLEAERANRLEIERRATFAEAGLSDHPARELLERAYEAGMTAETLKEQAAKYGLLGAEAATQANQEPVDRSDLEAIRRVGQASQGQPAAPELSFDEEMRRTRSYNEALSLINRRGDEVGIKLAETSRQGHRIV